MPSLPPGACSDAWAAAGAGAPLRPMKFVGGGFHYALDAGGAQVYNDLNRHGEGPMIPSGRDA